MILLVLFAAALAARVCAGVLFIGPAYPDSFYYVNLARELAAGHGFTINYIWNFVDVGGTLPAQQMLPIPSNAHWMPLAALVQVPFIWILGPTGLASALPFWVIGALAAPLTYLIAREAGTSQLVAVTAGLLAAVPAALLPFTAQPDNFGLFMVLGGLTLWLGGRAWSGDRRALFVGGLALAVATLSRTDGVLLGVPLAVAGLRHLWRSRSDARVARSWLVAGAASLALFTIVVAPWFARQLEVFGSLTPSAQSGRILWITNYEQLWSISNPPTLASFLAQGAGSLLASRVAGFVAAVSIYILWPLAAVLAPFAVIGAWMRRRDRRLAAFFLYAALLFAASGLFFAVHVPYGTFIHSAVALVPHTFVLAALGVEQAAFWLARRRAGWQERRASLMFASVALVVGFIAAGFETYIAVKAWQHDEVVRTAVAAPLAAAPASDRVMSGDSGAYNYLFGRPGVVSPDDPLDVIEQAARAYDIRWLALERDHIVSALGPVLKGEVQPAWLSRPLATVPGTSIDGTPAAALYAVCLSAADTRCAK